MKLDYLYTPVVSIIDPPIDGVVHELPIEKLKWENFEKLCLRLVEVTYTVNECELSGVKGQAQDGIDIFAVKGLNRFSTYQCKRYQEYPPNKIEESVRKFQTGKWFRNSDEFFLCTSCSLDKTDQQDKFLELKEELNNQGISFIKWDKVQLSRILKNHPQIVLEFFGKEWVRKFNGEIALSSLKETHLLTLPINDINTGFRKASLGLEVADHDIPGFGFIERSVTSDLIQWVKAPLQPKQDPIAVLEGGAGLGKTAILKDTLLELRRLSIPTLALKADRLYAASYNELQKQLAELASLPSIQSALYKLVEGGNPVVVLIDQLDALSQSLSTNRKFLNSYREFIQDVLGITGIRVIVSCRTFDLETDPLLQSYKGKRRFKVEEIEEEKVRKVISESAFSRQYISPRLLSLLKTPLHLRIFCQLNITANISDITTLQDLYTILYEQKILQSHETDDLTPIKPKQLSEFLNNVAQTMYDQQQLTIAATRFENDFAPETKYALSHNLLAKTRNGKQLQFFHQSFFDYLFARQFVDKGKSLTELLQTNHQGLFIRSAVRQILSYLKDYNERSYLLEVKQILCSSENYRYHIQLLVCQGLGNLTAPNIAEKLFVKKDVLTSESHRNPFLESVRSRSWADWLCSQGLVKEILCKPTEIARSEENLLRFLSMNVPDLALEQIKAVEVNDITGRKVCYLLRLISHSTEALVESTIEKFKLWMLANNPHSFYDLLSTRAKVSPGWTAEQLFEALKDESKNKQTHNNHQAWELASAIEELLKHHPDLGFKLCKNLIEHWVDHGRFDKLLKDRFDIKHEVYKGDIEFTNYDPSESHTHYITHKVYKITQDFLANKAKEDLSYTNTLLKDWLTSKSSSLLKLCATTYLANPKTFAGETIKLLTKPDYLRQAKSGRYIHYYLRQLISVTYEHLTPTQKTELHCCILNTLNVNSWYKLNDANRTANDPKRYLRTYYGELTYSFISAIPDVESILANNISKTFKELKRRHGDIKYEAPRMISWRSGDPSPVAPKQIEFLTLSNWLKAFRKHQNSPKSSRFEDYEAGLARSFKEQVKGNPSKYMPIIDSLLEDRNIDLSSLYLENALEGLRESGDKFDPVYYESVLLTGIQKGKISHKNHTGIRLLEFCIDDGICTECVVHLLVDAAISHLNDERQVTGDSVDELMDGINSVGGIAAKALTTCYRMTDKTSLITQTLEKVASEGSGAVRAATLYRLAYLLNLYPEPTKVVELYIKLIGTNYRLIKASEWTLQYLIRKSFKTIAALFREAIVEPFSHESISKIITIAWLWKLESAHELLQFYWHNSVKSRAVSLRFMMDEYQSFDNDQKKKAQQMFTELMTFDDTELRQAFRFCFYRLKAKDFSEWVPILREYVKTSVSKGRDGSFYDYLQSCVQEYPAECIELTSFFDAHDKPDMQRNDLEQKPLELLLSAYQILTEVDSQSPLIEITMDIFDRMLKQETYRSSATNKLELVDRY